MKTVLITGCNRGLGRTLLEDFSKEGYDVIVLNRKKYEEFDKAIVALQNKFGTSIKVYYADFSSKVEIDQALDQIETLNVRIDVVVNNAGINNSTRPLFNTEYEEIKEALFVNYLAPFEITKRVASMMIRQDGGSVINISSTVSINTDLAESSYGASKAALNLFTKSIAQELAPFNIRVNAIACGVMGTEMFNGFDEKVRKKALKRIALKRPADLQEISNMVLFLASEKSSYITGAIIPVDGGFM